MTHILVRTRSATPRESLRRAVRRQDEEANGGIQELQKQHPRSDDIDTDIVHCLQCRAVAEVWIHIPADHDVGGSWSSQFLHAHADGGSKLGGLRFVHLLSSRIPIKAEQV